MIERENNKDNSLGMFSPRIFDARDAFDGGQMVREGENYRIKLPDGEQTITSDHIHDLLSATMMGINEAFVDAESGIDLREEYEHESAIYDASVIANGGDTYGTWVYYPYDKDLVHFAPKRLHKLALLACNSSLLMDPDRNLDYNQIRKVFDNVVPAIAGLSVGSNIGKAIIADIRPDAVKVSDPAPFKLTNANRVAGLGYTDLVTSRGNMGSNLGSLNGSREKQQVFTLDILSQDPYMNVFSYKGIDGSNVKEFLGGGSKEPKATVAIDVCDSIDVKMQLAVEARKQGIRFLRFTDAGSTVRVDIRPFDTNPEASLAYGITDEELFDLLAKAGTSKSGFYKFGSALIGKDSLERGDEFGGLVRGEISKQYSSVPQLGSTAMVAGGLAGEIVARMALGYKYPERFVVDLVNLKFESWGEQV